MATPISSIAVTSEAPNAYNRQDSGMPISISAANRTEKPSPSSSLGGDLIDAQVDIREGIKQDVELA